jgi:Ca2+-binding RTX toxin-like protein
VHADVDSNSIWDEGQGVTSGPHGGILLFARDSGDAVFNLVGNTMDKIHGDGLSAENELHSPSRFEVKLFDDIIANTSGAAVRLVNDPGTTGPFAVQGGHNDLYANAKPNHLAGTSIGRHLTVPPRFINPGAGNLQLSASSPLINKGATCSPGGVGGPDAAGKNRLFGPAVDIGAYEWNAGPPGMVEVGTKGADTMTGGPRADILCGGGGDDMLFGNGGPDFLDGGKGSDRLYGGTGRDRLFGELGNDMLCAHDGKPGDYLNGGKGHRLISSGPRRHEGLGGETRQLLTPRERMLGEVVEGGGFEPP